MKTFEDCLFFIENQLGIQLLSCQKEMLQKLYENEHYYFLPGRAYGRENFLKAAELLEEMKKGELIMNVTMKPLRYFYCPDVPTHDDIEEARKITQKNDCYIQINYTRFGYAYSLPICPGDTHEEVLNRLPKVYGL